MIDIATGDQRTTLIALLAAGALLVVGGAIGVGSEQNSETPAATDVPMTTPGSFDGATPSEECSGLTSGSFPATGSPGGATTSEEFFRPTSGSLRATGSRGRTTTSQKSTHCHHRCHSREGPSKRALM